MVTMGRLLTRRFVAGAGLTLIGGAVLGRGAHAAPADPILGGAQAEWRQGFDAGSSGAQPRLRTATPILSAETVAATESAILSLQAVVAQGGWPPLQLAKALKLGARGDDVLALRRRLVAGGDLEAARARTQTFDSYVEAAVKRVQARHGLGPTGVVGPQTLAALNTPAEKRLRQLEINLIRLRTMTSADLGARHVTVNIPAAAVETVEGGVVATRHAAGVGKIDRQSPVFNGRITEVNFNPFWTVPASIIRKDLIPKMQQDPTYLTEQKIRIYNREGQELDPAQVDWFSDEATNYMFRQDPGGERNSMGFVRINIPNPHGVFMHDTPAKGIFGDDFRFVSSGCVRVQNVRDYIQWLLKETPGWDRAAIDRTFESGERIDAPLAAPVPVYWVYITSWSTPEGVMQFRDDIYAMDGFGPGAVTEALQQEMAEQQTQR
jgi:murein L,D-transpeptidase YcbB/YkuD